MRTLALCWLQSVQGQLVLNETSIAVLSLSEAFCTIVVLGDSICHFVIWGRRFHWHEHGQDFELCEMVQEMFLWEVLLPRSRTNDCGVQQDLFLETLLATQDSRE